MCSERVAWPYLLSSSSTVYFLWISIIGLYQFKRLPYLVAQRKKKVCLLQGQCHECGGDKLSEIARGDLPTFPSGDQICHLCNSPSGGKMSEGYLFQNSLLLTWDASYIFCLCLSWTCTIIVFFTSGVTRVYVLVQALIVSAPWWTSSRLGHIE